VKGFNPWVSADGTVLRDTPCPYTPEFWEGAITPRAVAIFAALGEEPIGAVVVDMEMYGAHRTFYEGECYCDRCFARYLEKTGKHSTLPPPGDRARTIADTGQIGTYRTLQRERARELAAAFLSAVQRARRGVRLGVLHLDIPASGGRGARFRLQSVPCLLLHGADLRVGFHEFHRRDPGTLQNTRS